MELFFLVTVVILVVEFIVFFILSKHIKLIATSVEKYQKNNLEESSVKLNINIYEEKNLMLQEKNKKLEAENAMLQDKISKINNQMKQITTFFKKE